MLNVIVPAYGGERSGISGFRCVTSTDPVFITIVGYVCGTVNHFSPSRARRRPLHELDDPQSLVYEPGNFVLVHQVLGVSDRSVQGGPSRQDYLLLTLDYRLRLWIRTLQNL